MPTPYEHLDDATRAHMVEAFDAAAEGGPDTPALMSRHGAGRFRTLVRDALRAGDEAGLARTLAHAALWKLYGPGPRGAGLVRTDWVREGERLARAEFGRWYEAGLVRRRQAEAAGGANPLPAPAVGPPEPAAAPAVSPSAEGDAPPPPAAVGATGGRVAAGLALGVMGLVGVGVLAAVRGAASAAPEPPAAGDPPAGGGGVDGEALFRWAYEQVDQTDWTRQGLAPGDERLAAGMTRDKPDLTRSMVEQYLAFHAWVWGRAPTPPERKRVEDGLGNVWGYASVHWDNRLPREALARLCLWRAVARLPAREQQDVRSALRRRLPDGDYGPLDPRAAGSSPQSPPAARLAEEMQASDMRTKVLIDLLRNMGGGPGAPPGFWA